MPLISIIVPVFNVEKYLRKCLDSIINQTFRDIEIICVHDGPANDNSIAILNEYAAKDERIMIIVRKTNDGQGSARNEGIKHASAEYIGFIDSDDWIELETYELAYKTMTESNSDLVIWYAMVDLENSSDVKNEVILKQIEDRKNYFSIKHSGFFNISDDIFLDCTVNVWSKLFKKSLIEKYGISFPEGVRRCEDMEFFFKYALICQNVFFIDKYLYHCVQRAGSTMWDMALNKAKLYTDGTKVMNRLYQYFYENKLLTKYKQTVSMFIHRSFMRDCHSNSKINQLYIYWYASKIVKKMDLSLLDDPHQIFNNLKSRNYSALFYFLNNETLSDVIFRRLKNIFCIK